MQTVERVVSEVERKRAEALAACERRVAECESRLRELENYQKSYAGQFQARAGEGIGAAGLRDFQIFMARLDEAVKQQTQILLQARAERDATLRTWQHAARRAEAVGSLVKRWQSQEQRQYERREQLEADERSQRPSPYALSLRGN
jgi:flagellar FliJ protein